MPVPLVIQPEFGVGGMPLERHSFVETERNPTNLQVGHLLGTSTTVTDIANPAVGYG
jgi:hypothetical protein